MEQKLDEDLKTSLIILCKHLQEFHSNTERLLEISKQRLEQIQTVRKPWILPSTIKECVCNSTETVPTSDSSEEQLLFNNITKTLNTAQTLRTKSLTKLKQSKESTKSRNTVVKTSVSMKKDIHKPSCSFYKTVSDKSLNLSEVVSSYKIPAILLTTLKLCNTFLMNNNSEKSSEKFLLLLEKQNQTFWSGNQTKNLAIYSFPKYISTAKSLRKKCDTIENINPWFLYKNVEDLFNYVKCNDNIVTSHKWSSILQYIINHLLPKLEETHLDTKQKLYMYKMLKTICNFVVSTTPNVPIFQINMI